eukprot:TRINITY_DN23754_c0_g1_i1.p1 TRINITY_DN23754_c0_g1~~TRINITY_DN23754_c0_g1_i1.p1  ORF type:complete len:773 (+),score=191.55 TRINITY_DN23754_c0_g1_i1:85-2403(+)
MSAQASPDRRPSGRSLKANAMWSDVEVAVTDTKTEEVEGEQCTMYCVEVRHQGEVQTRDWFRFSALYDAFATMRLADPALPSLPSKIAVDKKSPAVIKSRAQACSKFLDAAKGSSAARNLAAYRRVVRYMPQERNQLDRRASRPDMSSSLRASTMRESSLQDDTGEQFSLHPGVLRLSPPKGGAKGEPSTVTVRSSSPAAALFRVRCTAPDAFSVRPHNGLLGAGQEASFSVAIRAMADLSATEKLKVAAQRTTARFAVQLKLLTPEELSLVRGNPGAADKVWKTATSAPPVRLVLLCEEVPDTPSTPQQPEMQLELQLDRQREQRSEQQREPENAGADIAAAEPPKAQEESSGTISSESRSPGGQPPEQPAAPSSPPAAPAAPAASAAVGAASPAAAASSPAALPAAAPSPAAAPCPAAPAPAASAPAAPRRLRAVLHRVALVGLAAALGQRFLKQLPPVPGWILGALSAVWAVLPLFRRAPPSLAPPARQERDQLEPPQGAAAPGSPQRVAAPAPGPPASPERRDTAPQRAFSPDRRTEPDEAVGAARAAVMRSPWDSDFEAAVSEVAALAADTGFERLRTVKVKPINQEVQLCRKRMGSRCPVPCFRAEAEVACTPQAAAVLMRRSFHDERLARRLTVEISSLKLVESFPGGEIFHEVDNLPWPLSARDFVYLVAVKELNDGSIVIAQHSVVHPSVPQRGKTPVRGELHIAGYVVQPVPGRPDACRITQLGLVDPKGSIPTSVLEYFVDDMAHWYGRLQKEVNHARHSS